MSENKNEGKNEEEENLDLPTPTEGEEDKTDWQAEAQTLREKAIRQREQTKNLKAQLAELKTSEAEKKDPQKSNDLDYGAKAYLTSNGIKGAKEFEFVKAELKSSGGDLDSLLENDYFKAKLEKFRGLAATAEATPTGKRSSGVATESVEYWMTKPFEEVPYDMRRKVVAAKLAHEENKGKFYNSPK